MYSLLRYIPKNHLSALVGVLAQTPIPRSLRSLIIGTFAKCAGVNVREAQHPLQEYRSISDFFVRDLIPGVRPLQPGIVSPVDGAIRSISKIEIDSIEQVKGRSYSFAELLGDADAAAPFFKGTLCNLYLSPPDYHHVHVPFDCEVRGIRYIPGNLWPVNDWALSNVDNLFSRNERVVIDLSTQWGLATLVMVGATNVGKIALTFDPFVSNGSATTPFNKRYESPIHFQRGERIGTFHLGSTVIMVLDSKLSSIVKVARNTGKVKLGETLFHLES